MGTASLAIGIGLVIAGFGYFLISVAVPWEVYYLDIIIFSIPLVVVGGFFLRKYDRDKKKENGPIQNNEPENKEEKMSKSEYQITIIVVAGLTIAIILIIALSSLSSARPP